MEPGATGAHVRALRPVAMPDRVMQQPCERPKSGEGRWMIPAGHCNRAPDEPAYFFLPNRLIVRLRLRSCRGVSVLRRPS